MRAMTLIQKSTLKALSSLNGHRRKSFWWGVEALIAGGKLVLTDLGRAGAGLAYVKHKIKRADRLLGSEGLQQEILGYYGALAQWLLRDVLSPIILIDWTSIGTKHYALVASLPLEGRSVTLYAEVHPKEKLASRAVEKRFLESLSAILPDGCVPIIVTDAGFRTPWFDAVRELEWEFVGRLRHNNRYRNKRGQWVRVRSLYRKATKRVKCLGELVVTQSNARSYRVVLIRKDPKNRKHINKHDKTVSRQSTSRKCANREKEPWLLVTNLQDKPAKEIVGIYKKRMQIEETFRDLKSHRFGWSFEDARSSSSGRLSVLLVIATYAHLALLLLGMAIRKAGLHKRMQANTKEHQVYSLAFLAAIWLRTKQTVPIDAFKSVFLDAKLLFEAV